MEKSSTYFNNKAIYSDVITLWQPRIPHTSYLMTLKVKGFIDVIHILTLKLDNLKYKMYSELYI